MLITACAASRESKYAAAVALDQPPANFTLSITVQGPPTRGKVARSAAPARYILEPDGLLRAGVGRTAANEQFYPVQTRRLDDEQMRRVWLALRDGPLFRIDHPAIVPLPPAVDSTTPPPKKTTYTVTYIAGDVRQILVIAEDRPGAEDVGVAARLADQLAELAWIK